MQLVIIHPDKGVRERFLYFLQDQVTLRTYSDVASYLADFKQGSRADAVLCDQTLEGQAGDIPEPVIYGVSHPHEPGLGPNLYYFQSQEDFMAKLCSLVTPQQPIRKIGRGQLAHSCLIFAGVRGNVGTTTLAWATAKLLAQDHKVCYLALAPFQDQKELVGAQGQSFSKVIAALHAPNWDQVHGQLVSTQRLSYFPALEDDYDLAALTGGQLIQLLDYLLEQEGMDVVVCDCLLANQPLCLSLLQYPACLFLVDSKGSPMATRAYLKHLAMDQGFGIGDYYLVGNRLSQANGDYDICFKYLPPGQGDWAGEIAREMGRILWI